MQFVTISLLYSKKDRRKEKKRRRRKVMIITRTRTGFRTKKKNETKLYSNVYYMWDYL